MKTGANPETLYSCISGGKDSTTYTGIFFNCAYNIVEPHLLNLQLFCEFSVFLQNSTFCASNTSNHSVEFQVAVSCYSGNNIAMGNSQPMTVYRESLTRFPAAVPHRSGTNEIKSLVQDTPLLPSQKISKDQSTQNQSQERMCTARPRSSSTRKNNC